VEPPDRSKLAEFIYGCRDDAAEEADETDKVGEGVESQPLSGELGNTVLSGRAIAD